MFTKEELLIIKESMQIADDEIKKAMDLNKNNKNQLVAYNRKQKKLWLVQNKLNKILDESKN